MTAELDEGDRVSPLRLNELGPFREGAFDERIYLCAWDGSVPPEPPSRSNPLRGMHGYLYAIEIVDVGVKVGMSERPHARLWQHQKAARRHGHEVCELWISKPHVEWRQNEQALLKLCRKFGKQHSGKEMFTGLDPYDVCILSMTLPMTALTMEHVTEILRDRFARTEALKSLLLNGPSRVITGGAS